MRAILKRLWKVQEPSIAHGPEGIQAVGHRQYVGGLWEEIGKLQFEFLVANGLQPHHVFLDVACGCLRGGVHFIPYLESGHYLGIDKEPLLIQAGIEELGPMFETKRPELLVSDSFAFERFTRRPTHAIAQSLFTHLPPPLVSTCLRKLRSAMDGEFYATFHLADGKTRNPRKPHDHGHFAYTRQEMERFGEQAGWRANYIGDWSHPRKQVIVRYST